jgi:hypothetical protein
LDNGDGDRLPLSLYHYDKLRTNSTLQGMRRSQTYKLIPTPEQLAARFLGDVLAAAAGVEPDP